MSYGANILNHEDERQSADSIFKLHGEPIPIYLHPSLSRGGSRAIAKKIEDAGGNPYATEEEARVIICRYGTPIFSELEFVYDHDRYKWVEPPSWVDTCIDLGEYEHYLSSKTDKIKRHNTRTPFSLEDDENLVKFLARRIPYKDSGGRLGNGVYKDLCDERRASLYPWANHHPWQSWRDRYSKNQDKFDLRIDYEVNRHPNPPAPGGKGQYMISRKSQPQPLRHNVDMENEFDDDEIEEEEGQEEHLRQQEQVRQEKLRRKARQKEGEEDEADDDDGVIDAFHIIAKKRSRREAELQDGRIEQSTPPPRKHPRISVNSFNSEDDAFIGIGQDKGRGRGRQLPSNSEFERPGDIELNEVLFSAIYDDNEPGPSQQHEEHRMTDVDATTRSSNAADLQESSHPHPLNVSDIPPPAAPSNVPPDTQATIVPSSAPRDNSERPQRAARRGPARKSAWQSSITYNTRSRPPPEGKFFQLDDSQPAADRRRSRGRPKKPPLPYVSLQGTTSASLGEEVQVENILQVSEEKNGEEDDHDSDSSSESLSSEDDEAAQMLRNANKQMINEGTRSRSRPRNTAAAPNLREVPFIDISREAVRPSRKLAVLQPSSANGRRPDSDPDLTPKAQPINPRKAAKKTAAQGPSNLHDSDSDLESGTTESSFPVEATNAREYLNAQSPYTPAPGTKAEEHIRSERGKTRQAGRRGR